VSRFDNLVCRWTSRLGNHATFSDAIFDLESEEGLLKVLNVICLLVFLSLFQHLLNLVLYILFDHILPSWVDTTFVQLNISVDHWSHLFERDWLQSELFLGYLKSEAMLLLGLVLNH